MKYHNINGQLTAVEDAYIHISDLAIHRGYGIFDYFWVVEGQPLFLEDYLDRFERSAKKMQLEIPVSRTTLKAYIYELFTANEAPTSAIKIILSGGYSGDGYTPEKPNLILMGMKQPRYSTEIMEKGFHLITHEHVRAIADVKTTNYVASILAMREVKAKGGHDVLYHKNGLVSESSRSNFFLVKQDNTIVTAASDILYGITRKQIIDLAKQEYKVEIRDVFLDEVFSAKEAFITSSTKGALAVTRVDNKIIGDGNLGKVTLHLDKLFSKHVQTYLESTTVNV